MAAAPSPALTPGGIPAVGNAGLGRTPSADLPCPSLYDGGWGGGEPRAPLAALSLSPAPRGVRDGAGMKQRSHGGASRSPPGPRSQEDGYPEAFGAGSDLLMESPQTSFISLIFLPAFLLPFFIPFRQKSQQERFPSTPRQLLPPTEPSRRRKAVPPAGTSSPSHNGSAHRCVPPSSAAGTWR